MTEQAQAVATGPEQGGPQLNVELVKDGFEVSMAGGNTIVVRYDYDTGEVVFSPKTAADDNQLCVTRHFRNGKASTWMGAQQLAVRNAHFLSRPRVELTAPTGRIAAELALWMLRPKEKLPRRLFLEITRSVAALAPAMAAAVAAPVGRLQEEYGAEAKTLLACREVCGPEFRLPLGDIKRDNAFLYKDLACFPAAVLSAVSVVDVAGKKAVDWAKVEWRKMWKASNKMLNTFPLLGRHFAQAALRTDWAEVMGLNSKGPTPAQVRFIVPVAMAAGVANAADGMAKELRHHFLKAVMRSSTMALARAYRKYRKDLVGDKKREGFEFRGVAEFVHFLLDAAKEDLNYRRAKEPEKFKKADKGDWSGVFPNWTDIKSVTAMAMANRDAGVEREMQKRMAERERQAGTTALVVNSPLPGDGNSDFTTRQLITFDDFLRQGIALKYDWCLAAHHWEAAKQGREFCFSFRYAGENATMALSDSGHVVDCQGPGNCGNKASAKAREVYAPWAPQLAAWCRQRAQGKGRA